ncbi:uncharacterized protein G2W53_018754 [Senna tora]|uniref:Endonuclease/exonuclease/phosphatase domain-containing protein n=1 Tax=Senna tora TaxID=362788 RepID=A0A834TWD1_9FABA|nr:uncharacterized protein G2W53_018754 [Senna tora]
MAEVPNFMSFLVGDEAITEDYYGSSNIGFHVLVPPSARAFLDLKVNCFHISSRSSANSIYNVRFQSFPREDPAQTKSLCFPSMDAGEDGFNTLVWNVRGIQIRNSPIILRELISRWNISIVVLTETRVPIDADSRSLIRSFGLPYRRAYAGSGQDRSVGGLLCDIDFVVFL